MKRWFTNTTLLAILCFHTLYGLAQGENNIWINNYAFISVNFNRGADPVFGDIPLSAAWFGPFARTASVCDASGRLLFYTNGRDIYTREGTVMPNGSTDLAIPNYYFLTPALIMQLPGNASRYYVFTLSSDDVDHADLYYSIVDMSLNEGKGDIDPAAKNVMVRSDLMQSFLTGARGEGCSMWLSVREKDKNTFISFPITSAGIGAPVYSVAGPHTITSAQPNVFGLSNFMFGERSGDGSKMSLVATEVNSVNEYASCTMQLLDFDRSTGQFSDNTILFHDVTDWYWFSLYPSCFSPDDSKLYTTDIHNNRGPGRIIQYDLNQPSADAVRQSKTVVDTLPVPNPVNDGYITDMRLGPDKRIYIASLTPTAPARINKPDLAGPACAVQRDLTQPLSFFSVPVLFAEEALIPATIDRSNLLGKDTVLCTGQELLLELPQQDGDHYTWQDGTPGNRYIVNKDGTYAVTLQSSCGAFEDSIHIGYQPCACSIIQAPTAFSPNGDGLNDEFLPLTDCGSNILSYDLDIYNRWGQQVFSSMDAHKGWNGRKGDTPADAGTYFYTVRIRPLQGTAPLFKKGDIILLR